MKRMEPTSEQLCKYGTVGSRAGTWFRQYCYYCADPIRVADMDDFPQCQECSGERTQYRQMHGSKTPGLGIDEDAGGYRAIAVRVLEDGL